MEGIWFVIVIIAWIVSAVSKASKQQQEQAKKAAQPTRTTPAPAPAQVVHPTAEYRAKLEQQRAAAHRVSPTPHPVQQPAQPTESAAFVSAHSQPMETHMHTPVMGEEGSGTEGIDCCHEFMLGSENETEAPELFGFAEEDGQDRAESLLQGVIFSEILGRRPVRRPCGRRSA